MISANLDSFPVTPFSYFRFCVSVLTGLCWDAGRVDGHACLEHSNGHTIITCLVTRIWNVLGSSQSRASAPHHWRPQWQESGGGFGDVQKNVAASLRAWLSCLPATHGRWHGCHNARQVWTRDWNNVIVVCHNQIITIMTINKWCTINVFIVIVKIVIIVCVIVMIKISDHPVSVFGVSKTWIALLAHWSQSQWHSESQAMQIWMIANWGLWQCV